MSLHTSGVIRVITDPEAMFFESGSSVVKFYGGSNEGKDKDGNWIRNGIDVEAWNKTGQVVLDYAPKGSSVFVQGTVLKQEWEDKETGAKRSKHILRANRIELLPRQGQSDQSPLDSPANEPGDEEIPF